MMWTRATVVALVAALAATLSAAAAVPAQAGEVRAAVAANFTAAAEEIAAGFEAATGHKVLFSFGATGQLFAQITQGAPFDVFLSADETHAERAVAEGHAVEGTRFTYAVGRLVLYSRTPGFVEGEDTLSDGAFEKIAIANPDTAPYGAAAVETMRALGVYDALRARFVQGNNVTQTFQFVATGNAELGFVALSQTIAETGGSQWVVPEALHSPIAQDAVLLVRGDGDEAARAFLDYLQGEEARDVIQRFGYGAGG